MKSIFVCLFVVLATISVVSAAPTSCAAPRTARYLGPINTYACGLNWAGQLGFENNRTYEPQRFFMSSHSNVAITRIEGGFQHTITIEEYSGSAFSAGRAADGALGLGPQVTTQNVPVFNQIVEVVDTAVPVSIRNQRVIDVCAGWHHSCIVVARSASQNIVYCSGKNDHGQLGTNEVTTSISTMLKVKGDTTFAAKSFVNVSCGADHTVATASDGTVWAWGNGEEGSLGNGATASSVTPVQVTLASGVSPKDVSCGYRFCVLLATDGSLWGWGYNKLYQLGDASAERKVATMVRLIASGVDEVSAGGYHVLAVVKNKLYSWGLGTLGQTAQPKPFADAIKKQWQHKTITAVSEFKNVNIQHVSAGIKHSMVLDTCGNVYSFGSDAFGQLGVGYLGIKKTFRSLTPVSIPRVAAWQLQVVGVGAVGYHSFIIAKRT
eukprot:PhM_4_TR14336/c0_g1_i1/m.107117